MALNSIVINANRLTSAEQAQFSAKYFDIIRNAQNELDAQTDEKSAIKVDVDQIVALQSCLSQYLTNNLRVNQNSMG